MKPCIRFFLPVLVSALGLILASQVTAQTFKTLYSFTGVSDGANPSTSLILSGEKLYGATFSGGSLGNGTVFAINTNGGSFTNLHDFAGYSSDGGNPNGSLCLSSNTLCGATYKGGIFGAGFVFNVSLDSTIYTKLHSFRYSDGDNPLGVILSGTTAFGTTYDGGAGGYGNLFAINIDGTGFTNLYNFTVPSHGTNADGAYPQAGLILSGDTLYGTTSSRGNLSYGTVFAIKTNGAGFMTLHNFAYLDGFVPCASLTLSGNTLYGTAHYGGNNPPGPSVPSGVGTVFAVDTDGTGFRVLHYFSALINGTNSDGANPGALLPYYSGISLGSLVVAGDILYGTTFRGGGSGSGTVFAVNTDGTGFTTLYNFTAAAGPSSTNCDGTNPGSLLLAGNTLYGTAFGGGTSGGGTVFSLSVPPELTISSAGANLILAWPTNFTGFTLQSTTNLVAPVWTTNSQTPVVINGQNTVTNPIFGTQQFFRLSQ